MVDFKISARIAKLAAVILVCYFGISTTVSIALLTGVFGVRQMPHGAYIISPLVSFASCSLFYVRKIYQIGFSQPNGFTETNHDTPFLIYILIRPLFAVLIALLSVLAFEHLIEAVVVSPTLSSGFVLASAITALVLGTITGPAMDAVTNVGQRALARLEM